jgi:acyl dehydratase
VRGRYFDELAVGEVFHSPRRTITESDVVVFASLAGLRSPLFHDETFARRHHFGRRIVPGPLTFAYSVGLTEELTYGTVLAAVGFDEIRFHRPVFHGDTIEVRTEICAMRPSRSRPGTGLVTMRHTVGEADGDTVAEYLRTLLYGSEAYFREHGGTGD